MSSETMSILEDLRETQEYWLELALLEYTSDLAKIMSDSRISKAELARRLKCSPAHVTQVLSGNINCTLLTLVRFALAVGAAVHPRVKHIERVRESEETSDVAILDDYRAARMVKVPVSFEVTSDVVAAK